VVAKIFAAQKPSVICGTLVSAWLLFNILSSNILSFNMVCDSGSDIGMVSGKAEQILHTDIPVS
jgi:hypothetical protein